MKIPESEPLTPLRFTKNALYMLDQRNLPSIVEEIRSETAEEVAQGIRLMVVRGAPAIGIAAAYGMALEAQRAASVILRGDGQPEEACPMDNGFPKQVRGDAAKPGGATSPGYSQKCSEGPMPLKIREFFDSLERAAGTLKAARPTAVNLEWAVKRMLKKAESLFEHSLTEVGDGDKAPAIVERIAAGLVDEAIRIHKEDVEVNKQISAHGTHLLAPGNGVLTHCNAGALATGGYGTALGVIRAAWERGVRFTVFVDETRPFLQGARLTAWELLRDGVTCILITDNMAGYFMAKGDVDVIIVGADRVARNGDVANKIGTYGLSVLAREHGIPFYVAAPTSTLDLSLPDGSLIPIEERDSTEVTTINGKTVAPEGITVRNPAFDVTLARYITGIITERGIVYPPYEINLIRMMKNA